MHRVDGMQLGSFRARAAAIIIDLIIALTLSILVQLAIAYWREPSASDTTLEIHSFNEGYTGVWLVVYFALTTWLFRGRTPGKWLLRLRVISLTHERISPWGAVERALGYGISIAECGFGFLQYFIHPNCRTVHDRIAETIVVRERKARVSTEAAPE
jgi:uncharacterized RDD family membrane protein YckC